MCWMTWKVDKVGKNTEGLLNRALALRVRCLDFIPFATRVTRQSEAGE